MIFTKLRGKGCLDLKTQGKFKKMLLTNKKIGKFMALSYKVKLLFLCLFLIMGLVRLAILLVPFRYLTLIIGDKMTESPQKLSRSSYLKAARVGWAVDIISRFTPWESKCLVKSISAQIVLRLIKIPYTLYLGLAKNESNKLVAHAWLRCGELLVTGGSEKEKFVPVAHFSRSSENNN